MKAWRFYGFNDLRLDEVPAPACRPGQAAVRLVPPVPGRSRPPVPPGAGDRLRPARLFLRAGGVAGNRPGESGRADLRQRGGLPAIAPGIESVPRAFEITANKGKYQAINPAQVVIRQ
jgi:hypothetical protein